MTWKLVMGGVAIALVAGGIGLYAGGALTVWTIEKELTKARAQAAAMTPEARRLARAQVAREIWPPETPPPAAGADLERGRELYSPQGKAQCYECHGIAGRDAAVFFRDHRLDPPPTELADGSKLLFNSDADRFRVIKYGIPKTGMIPSGPGSQANLSDEDIWSLVLYIKALPEAPK